MMIKKTIYILLIIVSIFFLFRTNNTTEPQQSFNYDELPDYVHKISDIPQNADFILHWNERVFLSSSEKILYKKYPNINPQFVETLQLGHDTMWDIQTYRIADDDEKKLVYDSIKNLEFTNIQESDYYPAGTAYFLEFYWSNEQVTLQFGGGKQGTITNTIHDGDKIKITTVYFNAPNILPVYSLFENLFE